MDNPSQKEKKPLTPTEKIKAGQINLKEYEQLKAQQAAKETKAFRIPKPILIALSIPLILLAIYGVFFILYVIYSLMTSPQPNSP